MEENLPIFVGLLNYLARENVPCVLIGGLAVNLHGYERATGDVDVLMPYGDATAESLRQLVDDLQAKDFAGNEFSPSQLDGTHGVNGIRTKYGKLDVLLEGETPLSYDEVLKSSDLIKLEVGGLRVVGLSHLRLLKEISGRPRDLVDLEELGRAHGGLPSVPEARLDS